MTDEFYGAMQVLDELPSAQPETNCSEIQNSSDTISRQQALEAVFSEPLYEPGLKKRDADVVVPAIYEKIKSLQPAQPELKELSEWKAEFKGYINDLNMPKDDYDGILEYIDEVPPGQPDTTTHDSIPAETGKNDGDRTSGDCISRQQAIDALRKMQTYKLFAGDDMLLIDQAEAQTELMGLPSAQPEHKTGHWILDRSGAYCCNRCMEPCATYAMMKPRDKFCKMCGADMRGEQDG